MREARNITGKASAGQKSLSVDALVYAISDRAVGATLKELSHDHAYLTTANPPAVGEVIQVVAGKSLQSLGNVTSVRRVASAQYGFHVRLFQTDQADQAEEMDQGGWEFEPDCINEKSFQYYAQLKRVKEYIEHHYSESISLEKVAQIAAMEKSYFSTFFRQKVGVTYGKWLQVQRVARAVEAMKQKDLSITEICFAVGFKDLRTFERTFKRWTGLTPREFKKMVSPLLLLACLQSALFALYLA